jgi:hypothetical protein
MSSKRHVKRKVCGRKIKHETRESAYAARRKLLVNRPNETMDVYYCQYCNKWHVGHRPMRKKK